MTMPLLNKLAGSLLLGSTLFITPSTYAAVDEIKIDYAYYSPTSLVLKKFGWLEESLKNTNTKVKWVLSAGSNRALEYLNGNSVDFGSTAGLAAVLSKANGNPIKAIYVASRPEWTALAVAKDSTISEIQDLKGKKVAATKGTDPYLFLLRSLQKFGLKKSDIEIIPLQHPDGRAALEQGQVDAWAGLDPHLAASQLQAGSKIIYHNIDFNTYSFLNVREAFAKENPEAVKVVLNAYEQARDWIIKHPEEAATLQAEEAKIPLEVAKLQLSRIDFSNPVIGEEHKKALIEAAPILTEEGLVKSDTDVTKVVHDLIDPSFISDLAK